MQFEIVAFTKDCSAFLQNKLPSKMKDLGSFTICCYNGESYCEKKIFDLGVSINLMPMFVFRRLGIDTDLQIILVKSFLVIGRTLTDVQKEELTMQVQDDQETFNLFKAMKSLDAGEECSTKSEIDSLVPTEWELNKVDDLLERVLASNPPSDNKSKEVWLCWKPIQRNLFQNLNLNHGS
ncbi:reverse transcriptase [Gossypium australe]|uniref:Reverse transcriptase n=1 Tax=Gossypium australe TaxID=47621 RepID=A0A5B6WS94_9ROSI|nr:reverse transcriptase [Gossypium australe]